MLKSITRYFLLWRVFLFLPLILGYFFVSYRSGYEFTNIFSIVRPYFPVNNPLLFPWANFDGVHYLSIAGYGYTTEAAFFPLYPMLIKLVSYVMGGGAPLGWQHFFSALAINNLAFFIALVYFYKLLLLDYKKETALRSVLLLLVFPTAFFFGAVYSEGLFFLLLVLSFYFARKGRWFLASFFGMFLSATRLVGIFILPALLYEFWVQRKNSKKLSFEIAKLFVIPVGLVSYSYFNLTKWGDYLYFVHAHGELANSRETDKIILFPQTIYRYVKMLVTVPISNYEWWIVLLEVSIFIFIFCLLYLAWKKKVRTSYLVFSLLAFFLPASSGTFTGLPRYSLLIFPVFIALSLIKSKFMRISYAIIALILQFVLLMFFSRGYFVA